ncbi:MAG: ADP-ribosylglycohydrolase family protein [Bacilli bacterium]|nr:ADP-ribosylglycohydrolase family protein [Bacilli bacterium]
MEYIDNIIYGYIIGDSYGLGLLNNEVNNNSIKLIDNNNLNIEKGSYSSMTTFMLATLDSVTSFKNINIADILNKMCTSLILGKFTNDGKIYDLNNETLNILKHYSKKNNLNYNYNELDESSYALSRLLPIIIYNSINKDDYIIVNKVISLTNINEEVLFGSYIFYKYMLNLISGKDKYKALKFNIPNTFNKELVKKYKNLLKGNIFYKDIKFNSNIYNVLSVVFYVILHSDNFNDMFMMINNLEGNTNIYSSLICSIGGILYGKDSIDKSIIKDLKNKKEINKYIRDFKRSLKNEKVC